MNPVWPQVNVNYRPVTVGVECIMSTYFNGVDVSVAVIRSDTKSAERAAKADLTKKVKQRMAFE